MEHAFAKIFMLFLVVFALSSTLFCQDGTLSEEQIKEYANSLSTRIDAIIADAAPSSDYNGSMIVMGSGIGLAEQAIIGEMENTYPQMEDMQKIEDNKLANAQNYDTLILVGGPAQNIISAQFEANKNISWQNLSDGGEPFIIRKAELEDGRQAVIFSLLRGYENMGRENVKTSPLNALMPQKFVPAAATAIAIVLMALWPYILKALRMFFGKYFSAKEKQGKKMQKGGFGFDIGHTHLNLYEVLSILAAAAVFGAGMAWTFGAGKDYLLQTIGINIVVASAIFYGQSALRIIIAHFSHMKTQFQFWIAGSGITLISAYLGNMFASPGYFVEEEAEHENDKRTQEQKTKDVSRKAALVRIGIIGVTIAFGLVFFIINIIHPHKLVQLFVASCTLNAAVDMLPIKPMAGTAIMKWNWIVYLALAFVAWAAYVGALII